MFWRKGAGIFMASSCHGVFLRENVFSKIGRGKKRGGETYEKMVAVLQGFDLGRKALRVIPRGKQWLTVYRAHEVSALE